MIKQIKKSVSPNDILRNSASFLYSIFYILYSIFYIIAVMISLLAYLEVMISLSKEKRKKANLFIRNVDVETVKRFRELAFKLGDGRLRRVLAPCFELLVKNFDPHTHMDGGFSETVQVQAGEKQTNIVKELAKDIREFETYVGETDIKHFLYRLGYYDNRTRDKYVGVLFDLGVLRDRQYSAYAKDWIWKIDHVKLVEVFEK